MEGDDISLSEMVAFFRGEGVEVHVLGFPECKEFRPIRKLDGSYTDRCRDCGGLEAEHKTKPEEPTDQTGKNTNEKQRN
jgi:hypothetical protein